MNVVSVEIVEVHGHYQCAQCGLNVDECCQGETADNGCEDGEEKRIRRSVV